MNRRVAKMKIWLGVVLLVVLGPALFFGATQLLKPGQVVDSGERGLVVIATQGGSPGLTLKVRQSYGQGDQDRLLLFFTAENLTYGEGGNAQPTRVTVDFVGEAFRAASITCGAEIDAAAVQWEDVAPGPRRAIEVDYISRKNSAINYNAANDAQPNADAMSNLSVREFTIDWMWPLEPDAQRYRRQVDDRGNVFAEECVISHGAAWRDNFQDAGYALSSMRTLLPFQINWTSIGERTDVQKDMQSMLVIERSAGLTLSEAYPQPSVNDDDWFYWNAVHWAHNAGDVGNLSYSDQPVYIFADRTESDRKAILMLCAGALLGVAATVFVSVCSLILDLFYDRRNRFPPSRI